MSILDQPYIVGGIIVALVIVVIVAMKLGAKLRISKTEDGVTLDVEGPPREEASRISVAEGLQVGKDGEVGSMVGQDGSAEGGARVVEVAKNASVEGKVEEIVGKKLK